MIDGDDKSLSEISLKIIKKPDEQDNDQENLPNQSYLEEEKQPNDDNENEDPYIISLPFSELNQNKEVIDQNKDEENDSNLIKSKDIPLPNPTINLPTQVQNDPENPNNISLTFQNNEFQNFQDIVEEERK
jgi:hypothetical protein